jgi:protein TonB
MLRNSFIISTFIHLLLFIGVSLTSSSNMVPPPSILPKEDPVFFELYGDPSGTGTGNGTGNEIEAGSSGSVAVGTVKPMKQSGASQEKSAGVRKTVEAPPISPAEVQNQPATPSAVEPAKNTTDLQTPSDSMPGGSAQTGSNISTDTQNQSAGGTDGIGYGIRDGMGDGIGCGIGDGIGNGHGGIGLGSSRGLLLYAPQPNYPAQARRNNWEGATLLELMIGPEGRVHKVTVLQSSGYPLLDQAAEKALKCWRYRPYRPDGKGTVAIAWHTRVRIKFVLND